MKWDRRRYGFLLVLPLLADCLPWFLCVCLFRFPPGGGGNLSVTPTVPTALLQCQPNFNGSHVNPGVSADSKLRKCLSSGELVSAQIRVSCHTTHSSVVLAI